MKKFLFALIYLNGLLLSAEEMKPLEAISKSEFADSYEKAVNWFSTTPHYVVRFTYASYVDHSSLSPYETSEGVFANDGPRYYSNVLGTKTIVNEHFSFSVDSVQKLIVLNNTAVKSNMVMDKKGLNDFLANVTSVKKDKTQSGGVFYRLEFTPGMTYSSVEIELNEKGQLARQRFFYSTEVSENGNNDDNADRGKGALHGKPKLEITFSAYQDHISASFLKEFSEARYFTQSGNKIILQLAYRSYNLKDYRYDIKKTK